MSFEKLKSVLATSGDHLGDLVWWQLTGAEVERSRLESLWAGARLDSELLPEPPTAERALKCSIRECQVGQPEHLLRLGKEDEHEIVFAIVHEYRHSDGTLIYSSEARITLDRASGHLVSDQPEHELVKQVGAAFERLRVVQTGDDVRRTLTRTLKSFAAVTLRDSGGIYWAPTQFQTQLRQLQSVVEKLGESRLYLLPIHDTADATRTLGEVAKASVEEELCQIQHEIEAFLATPPERVSTLVRRLDAFEALRTRANLYRSVLQVHVTDLDKQLDELAHRVEGLLDQKSAA